MRLRALLLGVAVTAAGAGTAAAQVQNGNPPNPAAPNAGRQNPGAANPALRGGAAGQVNPNDPRFVFVPGVGVVPRNDRFFTGNNLQFVPGVGFVPSTLPNVNAQAPNRGMFRFVPNVGFVPIGETFGNRGFFEFVPGIGFVPRPDNFGNVAALPQANFQFVPNVGWVPANQFFGNGAPVPLNQLGFTFAPNGGIIAPRGGFAGVQGIPIPPAAAVDPNAVNPPAGAAGDQASGPMSATETRAASQARDIMNERPLVEGDVIEARPAQIMVRYRVDGVARKDRFPVSEVFFFRGTGELVSAATASEALAVGSRVLVPLPASARSSVAGSRQRTGGTGPAYQEERGSGGAPRRGGTDGPVRRP